MEHASIDDVGARHALFERRHAALHLRNHPPADRALRDELGLVTPEPIAASQRQRASRWQRVSVGLSMAAVLLILVAVIPALDMFGAGDADSTADVAFDTTTNARAESLESAPGGAADATQAPATTPAPSMTTAVTQAADETTTTAIPADGGAATVDFGTDPDLDAIRTTSEETFALTGQAWTSANVGDLEGVELDERVEQCKADGLEVLAAGSLAVELGSAVILESDVFIIAYFDEDTGEVQIVAHDVNGCAVVATSG